MSSIKEEIAQTLCELFNKSVYEEMHLRPEAFERDAEALLPIFKRHIEEAFDKGEKRGIHVAECWEFAKHPDSDENGPLSKSEYLKSKGITE